VCGLVEGQGVRAGMNEEQWLSWTDPAVMLAFLRGKASYRKLRLFACACVRRLYARDKEELPKEVEISERYAEGMAGKKELRMFRAQLGARGGYSAAWAANNAIHAVLNERAASAAALAVDFASTYFYYLVIEQEKFDHSTEHPLDAYAARQAERGEQAALLRDTFPNPFRSTPAITPDTLAHNDGILKLAQAAYDNRVLPAGLLDPARLAILADALEEAGADAALLEHLRGPGPHVRGCFALDAVLGKV
jgi:hypothetical protein